MSIELVDESAIYELKHQSGAVFFMKHWTFGMQDEVDRACIVQDGKGGFSYEFSKEREIKVRLAIHDWSGINLNGEPTPCTPENKRRLPVGIVLWLVREIDERAGLKMPEQEKKS